ALYSQPLLDLGLTAPLQDLTLRTFVGNLLFLQTIFCTTFGSNGPLWSLSNEFWYYVLFPLGFGAVAALVGKRFRSALTLLVLAAAVCFFLDAAKWAGFAIWLAGFALVILYARTALRSRSVAIVMLLVATLLLAGVLFAVRTSWSSPYLDDLAVGL